MSSHLLYIAEFKWHLKIPGSSWLSEKILFQGHAERETLCHPQKKILAWEHRWEFWELTELEGIWSAKGMEKKRRRKRWKNAWLESREQNDRKSGAIKESLCVRRGYFKRWLSGRWENWKNLSGTNSRLRRKEEVSQKKWEVLKVWLLFGVRARNT